MCSVLLDSVQVLLSHHNAVGVERLFQFLLFCKFSEHLVVDSPQWWVSSRSPKESSPRYPFHSPKAVLVELANSFHAQNDKHRVEVLNDAMFPTPLGASLVRFGVTLGLAQAFAHSAELWEGHRLDFRRRPIQLGVSGRSFLQAQLSQSSNISSLPLV